MQILYHNILHVFRQQNTVKGGINIPVNAKNNRGRAGLTQEEIDYIIKIYEQTSSLTKTCKITGFSRKAVNKYVFHLSSLDKHSRHATDRTVIATKGEQKLTFKNARQAALELNVHYTGVINVLKGKLPHIGGWTFVLAKDEQTEIDAIKKGQGSNPALCPALALIYIDPKQP